MRNRPPSIWAACCLKKFLQFVPVPEEDTCLRGILLSTTGKVLICHYNSHMTAENSFCRVCLLDG